METKEVKVQLTSKQSTAFRLLTDPNDLSLLYGGAKGGGKDFLFCVWVKCWVEHLIQFFDLKPSKDPIALGFVGRKRSVDFRDTTLGEFKKVIPADHYRLHNDEHEIIFHETAKVFCGGLDDPKRVEKFNSANLAFLAVNQAEETERQEVSVLRAALRLKINGKQPPYKELYTANPADCWLKTDFIDNQLLNHKFVPALYTDNPHLPSNYQERLETVFKYNEALLKAYRDGDWFSLQATNTLITDLMLNALKGVNHYAKEIRRIVSCDPSLGGDDCPIQDIENGRVMNEKVLHERNPMTIAGEMIVSANQFKTPYFDIDYSGGLGAAIAARIREVKPNSRVNVINSSETARDEEAFFNTRAEMWWYTMQQIQDKKIPFPEDEELRRQLTAVRFKVVNSNGRIQLEPKEETKKRLGRSPDQADTFVMGQYALKDTEPVKHKDAWADDSRPLEVSLGAKSAMAA